MSDKIIDFLKILKENNNREWFNINKNKYEKARLEFKEIVEQLIPKLADTVPGIRGLEAKDTIFRIYRDVRFSKEKKPYKTQMGAFLAPGGRKSEMAGYYFHMEPGNSFIAGGAYKPQGNILKNIRSEIVYNTEEYLSIITKNDFVKYFGGVDGEKLKRPPIGFPKDYEHMNLIKLKTYTIFHPVKNEFFSSPNMIENTISIFEKMNDFIEFLNRSFD